MSTFPVGASQAGIVFLLLTVLFCTPGHFLFLEVRERNSQQEASVQSRVFPPPVSSGTCQVSSSDEDVVCYRVYVTCALYTRACDMRLFFRADALLPVRVRKLQRLVDGGGGGERDERGPRALGEKRPVERRLGGRGAAADGSSAPVSSSSGGCGHTHPRPARLTDLSLQVPGEGDGCVGAGLQRRHRSG